MNILIIGDTAREHALAWKFAESRRTGALYCTSPYSGVDTLCTRIEGSPADWRASHTVDLVVGRTMPAFTTHLLYARRMPFASRWTALRTEIQLSLARSARLFATAPGGVCGRDAPRGRIREIWRIARTTGILCRTSGRMDVSRQDYPA